MCTARTHGCCCKNTTEPICPYHTAIRHLRRLRTTFGNDFDSPERDVPLFPNEHGDYMSHAEATNTIQEVIGFTGESLTRPGVDGKPLQRFAEHVLRVSGAQMMARGGMDLYFIQLMSRWGSNAIERYVQDAYLLDQQSIAMAVTDKIDAKSAQALPERNPNSDIEPSQMRCATQKSLEMDIENLRKTLDSLQLRMDAKTLILNT
jgi:hypothetical protein